ncbi:MAG TPA: hypothetical protein VKA46_20525 [Gemmataceae bacterium]|nr:hypothetical protein [Gemmataceae bacterium]
MQGLKGDGDAEGACEEVEGVVVGRVGVVTEELGDRPGVTWQKITVGAAGQASVAGLDNLLGGKPLVPRGGSPAKAGESCDLGHLEAAPAVQQQVAEEAAGVVILALLLPEAEDGVAECADLGGQQRRGKFGLGEPVLECGSGIAHEGAPCQNPRATTSP